MSLLDNGNLVQWNLEALGHNEIKFEDMKLFNSTIKDCCLPQIAYNSKFNQNNVISYCATSPDAKCNSLIGRFKVKSNIRTYDLDMDNPLSTSIRLCRMDQNGRFCFIVNEIEDFAGKQIPAENDFVKINCAVLDLAQNNKIIEQYSYVVRKRSRFEIDAEFLVKHRY